MSILLFLVFGFIVGLIARAVMPGAQRMGIGMTTILGVVGSFVGGLLVNLFAGYRVTDLHAAGLIGSVIGALLVLFIGTRALGARRI